MKHLLFLSALLALCACGRVAHLGQTPAITPARQSVEFIAMTEPPLNLPPSTGRPEAAAMLERLLDLAALELDLPPEEVRRRKQIPKDA